MTEAEVYQGYDKRQFTYGPQFQFTSEGQELTQYVKVTQDPFLLQRVDVCGYSELQGNILAIANSPLPPDRFMVTIENTTTNRKIFDTAIDLSRFIALRSGLTGNNITPMVILPNTEIKIVIKHDRAVSFTAFKEITAANPVNMQLIFDGAKLILPSNY
jgi:hypothetical protein